MVPLELDLSTCHDASVMDSLHLIETPASLDEPNNKLPGILSSLDVMLV